MSDFKTAIFDLDGVIVDTAKYHYLAWKRLAEELGFEFTEHDNERLKGVSRMKSLEILLEIGNIKLDKQTMIDMAEKKNKWYLEYIRKLIPEEILPGADDFLKEIRKLGVKTALGSASKNALLILHNLKIEEYFDAVIDGNCVSNAKPDPEVFLRAAQKLNSDPEECVVFEDAEAGIEAAKRAGMYAVGIGKEGILKKADVVINGFSSPDAKYLIELYK